MRRYPWIPAAAFVFSGCILDIDKTPGEPPQCTEGEVVCAGECVDLRKGIGRGTAPNNFVTHCGTCGKDCAVGQKCLANPQGIGECRLNCTTGTKECTLPDGSRACKSIIDDEDHCGDCNVACGPGKECRSSKCESICTTGKTFCPTAGCTSAACCVDTTNNHDFCGNCQTNCGNTKICVAGNCQLCLDNKQACGNVCVDKTSDAAHCGACNNACPKVTPTGGGAQVQQICVASKCVVPCTDAAKPTPCPDNLCHDLQTDKNACGACGNVCPPAALPNATVCRGGECVEPLTLAITEPPANDYIGSSLTVKLDVFANGVVTKVEHKLSWPAGTGDLCTATDTAAPFDEFVLEASNCAKITDPPDEQIVKLDVTVTAALTGETAPRTATATVQLTVDRTPPTAAGFTASAYADFYYLDNTTVTLKGQVFGNDRADRVEFMFDDVPAVSAPCPGPNVDCTVTVPVRDLPRGQSTLSARGCDKADNCVNAVQTAIVHVARLPGATAIDTPVAVGAGRAAFVTTDGKLKSIPLPAGKPWEYPFGAAPSKIAVAGAAANQRVIFSPAPGKLSSALTATGTTASSALVDSGLADFWAPAEGSFVAAVVANTLNAIPAAGGAAVALQPSFSGTVFVPPLGGGFLYPAGDDLFLWASGAGTVAQQFLGQDFSGEVMFSSDGANAVWVDTSEGWFHSPMNTNAASTSIAPAVASAYPLDDDRWALVTEVAGGTGKVRVADLLAGTAPEKGAGALPELRVSDDGARFLAWTNVNAGSAELWVVQKNGTAARVGTDSVLAQADAAVISDDGTTVAYLTPANELKTFRLPNGPAVTIEGNVSRGITIAPDGSSVVYLKTSPADLKQARVDGTETRKLADKGANGGQPGAYGAGPSGSAFAITVAAAPAATFTGTLTLAKLGSAPLAKGNIMGGVEDGALSHALVFAPNGTAAFWHQTFTAQTGFGKVVRASTTTGANDAVEVFATGRPVALTADGKKGLGFGSTPNDGQSDLYAVDLQTAAKTLLVEKASLTTDDWLSEGSYLLLPGGKETGSNGEAWSWWEIDARTLSSALVDASVQRLPAGHQIARVGDRVYAYQRSPAEGRPSSLKVGKFLHAVPSE